MAQEYPYVFGNCHKIIAKRVAAPYTETSQGGTKPMGECAASVAQAIQARKASSRMLTTKEEPGHEKPLRCRRLFVEYRDGGEEGLCVHQLRYQTLQE